MIRIDAMNIRKEKKARKMEEVENLYACDGTCGGNQRLMGGVRY